MIVRPLIPQQSTVNGKRKVISRYEDGGEASKTGIGNFAKQLRAYGERFPVYGIGSFGDIIDVAQQNHAIHFWHLDIRHQQRDVLFFEDFNGLFAVIGKYDLESILMFL